MSYQVSILDTKTGERRLCRMDVDWHVEDDGTPNLFWWTEGNFGCDCNRSLVYDENGEPTDHGERCSDGYSRFVVEYFIDPSGVVIPYPHDQKLKDGSLVRPTS